MAVIKFRYDIDEGLAGVIKDNMVDYSLPYLVGYLDQAIAGQLRYCAMYLMCDEIEDNSGTIYHKHPIAVVARNEFDAIKYYTEYTGSKIGTVFGPMHERCDKVKVVPL